MKIKIILLMIFAIAGVSLAFVSTSYETTPVVVDSAGGKATSASYSTSFAIGEVGMKTSSSTNYTNKSHFAYAFFTPPVVPVNTPEISLNKSALSFTAVQGGANPTSPTFSITNSGEGVLVPFVTDDMTWLSTSAPSPISVSGTQASPVTVSVNITGLTAGEYTGTIEVSDSAASNTPQTIGVTLTVSPLTISPEISITPTSLDFTAVQGGSNPASKTFTISNSGNGTLKWTATANKSWLSVSPADAWVSGTQTSPVSVTVNTSGLTAGLQTGTIEVQDSAASNSPQTVTVNLTVTSSITTTSDGRSGGGGAGCFIKKLLK